ncbi:MAG: exodeoxyribonuclease III [Alphaproteobacteria bacterium]|nr:exodeoxyribonuclease III [Alphaproteobacteria bacterium]
MKIATFNVNSVKARLDNVLAWFKEAAPDVVCLQEIKCETQSFPREAFEALGYNCAIHGQKTYNGVALISKHKIEDIREGLPGDKSDEQARYIEGVIATKKGAVRVASIYAPNGNPPETEKYPYKLKWMDRLIAHTKTLLVDEELLVLGGDYNIIPTADDVYDPKAWAGDALFKLESRQKLRRMLNLGLTDAFRACNAKPHQYTFWDYQAGAWQKDHGIRIDHLLLSPQAADRLKTCVIDQKVRGREKPSDHVPIWCELKL